MNVTGIYVVKVLECIKSLAELLVYMAREAMRVCQQIQVVGAINKNLLSAVRTVIFFQVLTLFSISGTNWSKFDQR